MSFSEDSMTPSAPFSGDGSVFDQPDVLLNLPTTSERVVDTQSGFLLVLRRVGERLSFSCKRRVGTPPSSSILLTPDESVKLSRALAACLSGLEDSLDPNGRASGLVRRKPPLTTGTARRSGVLPRLRRPAWILLAFATLAATLSGAFVFGQAHAPALSSSAVYGDALNTDNVAKFAHVFLREMLDFNPQTYKSSQVKAMAAMTPELLEKYWKETNFPLTPNQLKGLPQGASVAIERIDQQRLGPNIVTASIYAQLIHTDKKLSTPVRIKIKLTAGAGGSINVLEQEDLSVTGN